MQLTALAEPPVMVDPLVSLRGVGQVFTGRGRSVVALSGVDLDIGSGEFVSLLGPSGCGKSTLLRIIGGLQRPVQGLVEVAGGSAESARAGKQYGLVPQTPALVPWKTVADNVRFLSGLHRQHRAAHHPLGDAQIAGLLDAVGLTGFEKSYPHELSGGMQQRVALVRAFALGAPILLMDEPFAALDEITRADMRYLLLDLWERARSTVVFVTHSVTEAAILSDRVMVMAARPGRIAAERAVELPRPRTPAMEDSDAFHEVVRTLRADLRLSAAQAAGRATAREPDGDGARAQRAGAQPPESRLSAAQAAGRATAREPDGDGARARRAGAQPPESREHH